MKYALKPFTGRQWEVTGLQLQLVKFILLTHHHVLLQRKEETPAEEERWPWSHSSCLLWMVSHMSLQVSILSALLNCGRALPTFQTTNEVYLAAQAMNKCSFLVGYSAWFTFVYKSLWIIEQEQKCYCDSKHSSILMEHALRFSQKQTLNPWLWVSYIWDSEIIFKNVRYKNLKCLIHAQTSKPSGFVTKLVVVLYASSSIGLWVSYLWAWCYGNADCIPYHCMNQISHQSTTIVAAVRKNQWASDEMLLAMQPSALWCQLSGASWGLQVVCQINHSLL